METTREATNLQTYFCIAKKPQAPSDKNIDLERITILYNLKPLTSTLTDFFFGLNLYVNFCQFRLRTNTIL